MDKNTTVKPLVSRSIRVPEEVWDQAKLKAHAEGITPSAAIRGLLESYVHGTPSQREKSNHVR